MPHFLAPTLPTLIKDPFDSPDWIFEPKLGGYRAIAVIDATGKGADLVTQSLAARIEIPHGSRRQTGSS